MNISETIKLTDVSSVETGSPEETESFGYQTGLKLNPGEVVGLCGPLGAGKTCLVKGIARAKGFDGLVTSPAFVLIKEYPGDVPVYHFDLYRLSEPAEADMEKLGYRDYYFGNGITVVEWAEKAIKTLPGNSLVIIIETGRGNKRKIETGRLR